MEIKYLTNQPTLLLSSIISASLLLSACGGGNGSNENNQAVTPNTQTDPIKCVNGITQNLKTTGNGIFSNELFGLESIDDNIIFKSNTLQNGTWYENLTQLIPNTLKLNNDNKSGGYHISPTILTTSFKQKVGTAGFPRGYVTTQNNESFQVFSFSDDCNLSPERKIEVQLKAIDLSGKKFADLLAFYESNNPTNAKRLISSNINQNLSNNSALYQKLKNDPTTFPQGSKIYIEDKEIFTQPIISFYDGDEDGDKKEFRSLNDYAQSQANPLPSNLKWKSNTFAGSEVIYPVNAQTDQYVYSFDHYPAVNYKGKIYSGEIDIPGNSVEYSNRFPNQDNDMSTTYFNKTAAETFANILQANK